MKNLNIISAAAIAGLLLSANVVNAASTLTVPGASTINVQYEVIDGVATVYGTVEERIESFLVESAVQKLDGVNEVNNALLITQ